MWIRYFCQFSKSDDVQFLRLIPIGQHNKVTCAVCVNHNLYLQVLLWSTNLSFNYSNRAVSFKLTNVLTSEPSYALTNIFLVQFIIQRLSSLT